VEPAPSSESRGAASAGEVLPQTFGRYTLFDHIGRGGMADIYLAMLKEDLLERRVVVKKILPALSDDEGFRRMLIAEAKLAAKLNHANVVQVTDLGRHDGRVFIVMEYVEGFDLNLLLRHLSKARIPLPADFAVQIIRETLRALDYAHRARDADDAPLGIVHRDVSPSNVLISFEGEVKLCDFGIARALGLPKHGGPVEGRIARARIAGKGAYMAPEQARGEDIDARADVFAAGIQLWELCAGRRLYKGSDAEMLAMARAAEVPPLPARGLPEEEALQRMLDKALAPAAEDRFQTAAEFLGELERWAAGAGLFASQLKFGAFLMEHFGEAVVAERRARERRASEPPPPPSPAPIREPPEPQAVDEEVSGEPREARGEETARIATVRPKKRTPISSLPPPMPRGAAAAPTWVLAAIMVLLVAIGGFALWVLLSL